MVLEEFLKFDKLTILVRTSFKTYDYSEVPKELLNHTVLSITAIPTGILIRISD